MKIRRSFWGTSLVLLLFSQTATAATVGPDAAAGSRLGLDINGTLYQFTAGGLARLDQPGGDFSAAASAASGAGPEARPLASVFLLPFGVSINAVLLPEPAGGALPGTGPVQLPPELPPVLAPTDAVPLPAAAWLFMSAVAAAVALRRRR